MPRGIADAETCSPNCGSSVPAIGLLSSRAGGVEFGDDRYRRSQRAAGQAGRRAGAGGAVAPAQFRQGVVPRPIAVGSGPSAPQGTLHELTERGVTLRSLHDGVDTSTSTGRMVAGILMSIAEYERELVRERTALKLEHARKSGPKFGRPAKLNADQAALARRMKANGETAATICETLGIGSTTLYRYLAESDDD